MQIDHKDLRKHITLDDIHWALERYQADADHEDDIGDAFKAVDNALHTIRMREYSPAQSERNRQLEDARS